MVCLYLSNLYCNNKRPAQSKLARDWSQEISQIFTFSSREIFSLPCPPRFCRVKRHIIILKVLPQWQMNRRGGGWLLTLHYDDYSLFIMMIIHSSLWWLSTLHYRIPENWGQTTTLTTHVLLSLQEMNLEDQLGWALEELWQVALTVSTLKYVAGLLSQETVNMISNSLGRNRFNKQREKIIF